MCIMMICICLITTHLIMIIILLWLFYFIIMIFNTSRTTLRKVITLETLGGTLCCHIDGDRFNWRPQSGPTGRASGGVLARSSHTAVEESRSGRQAGHSWILSRLSGWTLALSDHNPCWPPCRLEQASPLTDYAK